MNIDEDIKSYLIIIIAVFTWSWSEIIVKLIDVGPFSLSFFRFFIGGLFLLVILAVMKDLNGIFKMIKDNWIMILISSSFALGISNVIYFVGINYTQANIGATIYTSYPIWITFYSFFILNERSNLKFKLIGIIIGLIGVMLLLTNFNILGIFSAEFIVGNMLVLIGSIIWGLYSVIGKKIQLNEQDTTNSALKFSLISIFFACVPIALIIPFTPELDTFMSYEIHSWFWIIFLGIICTGLGIFLLFTGLKHVEVSKGISLAFFKPVFATILAFFLLNELPTIALLISIPLVIISISMINKSPKSIHDLSDIINDMSS